MRQRSCAHTDGIDAIEDTCRGAARVDIAEGELANFEVFNTSGVELPKVAAENRRALRRRGSTIRKTVHGLIATLCLREGHSLLHRDRVLLRSTDFSICASSAP